MPYSLIFEYTDGRVEELKPICCDNPKSVYGYEDRSINIKAKNIASKLSKRNKDVKCMVVHYEDL